MLWDSIIASFIKDAPVSTLLKQEIKKAVKHLS